jgi:hypothetical protein
LQSALQIYFSIRYLAYLAERIVGSYPFKATNKLTTSTPIRHRLAHLPSLDGKSWSPTPKRALAVQFVFAAGYAMVSIA